MLVCVFLLVGIETINIEFLLFRCCGILFSLLVKKYSESLLTHTRLFMESGISFARLFISKPKQRKISVESSTLFTALVYWGFIWLRDINRFSTERIFDNIFNFLGTFSSPCGKYFSKTHDLFLQMVFIPKCNFFVIYY